MLYKIDPVTQKKTFEDSIVEDWRKQYEDGASLWDISAQIAAKGENVSTMIVAREISRIGGIIRNRIEAIRTGMKKRKSHIGPAFEKQHGVDNE